MYVTTLADPVRLQQIALLCGRPRPFYKNLKLTWEGECWACTEIAGNLFAVPENRHDQGLSFGPIAERVFWLLHAMVREQRTTEVHISYDEFRSSIWREAAHRNWISKLKNVLRSLSRLRIGHWLPTETVPPIATSLPLFQEVRQDTDQKQFSFVIAEGFLGSLEACRKEDDGQIQYDFFDRMRLRSLRKDGRLVDVYLPPYLGEPVACGRLQPRQKRLLQAVLQELTFPPRDKDPSKKRPICRSLNDGEHIHDAFIRSFNGKYYIDCPEMDDRLEYVGFNGNGVRRGQGYRLSTWRERAGYNQNETTAFLDDLKFLRNSLGLLVGVVAKTSKWHDLNHLQAMLCSARRRHLVESLHLRVYASANYLHEWNQLFGWDQAMTPDGPAASAEQLTVFDRLRELMARENLQQKDVATALGVSKQYVSKILRTESCSNGMLKKIESCIRETERSDKQPAAASATTSPPAFKLAEPKPATNLEIALNYLDRGWAVAPAEPGTKKPYVKWKPFQKVLPDRDQVCEWWSHWPDAGIAVVLGPVSDLLCVDVDGEEAHYILIDLFGEIPLAPTVKSGSVDPFRYHLYFRHPSGIETAASTTPWNDKGDRQKLELRGHKGILVLPPSVHKSGRQYGWVEGRTPDHVPTPELPDQLLRGLVARRQDRNNEEQLNQIEVGNLMLPDSVQVAKSTSTFLAGRYATAGGWNNRLFRAACDLHGRGVPKGLAQDLLLQGAQPRTANDRQIALDTINSAYSETRLPSEY